MHKPNPSGKTWSREPLAISEHCTAVLIQERDPATDGSSQHQYRTPQGKCYWELRMRERKTFKLQNPRLTAATAASQT